MNGYDPNTLSKNDAYDQARSGRRRTLVRVLLEDGAAYDVESLAAEVAAREEDVAPESVPEEAREEVYLALLHSDLPKLAAESAVEYDREDGTVEPGPNIEELEPLV